jgi:hypothetical protein
MDTTLAIGSAAFPTYALTENEKTVTKSTSRASPSETSRWWRRRTTTG